MAVCKACESYYADRGELCGNCAGKGPPPGPAENTAPGIVGKTKSNGQRKVGGRA